MGVSGREERYSWEEGVIGEEGLQRGRAYMEEEGCVGESVVGRRGFS